MGRILNCATATDVKIGQLDGTAQRSVQNDGHIGKGDLQVSADLTHMQIAEARSRSDEPDLIIRSREICDVIRTIARFKQENIPAAAARNGVAAGTCPNVVRTRAAGQFAERIERETLAPKDLAICGV